MRLTPEFMSTGISTHQNPLKERELDLRGNQIPVIENLASHQGSYDTLNLTDNSITVLGNIPLSPRLSTIHLGTNHVHTISPNLSLNVPNLTTLILTSNAITSLAQLVPLENLVALRHLSLSGNPVAAETYYKEFAVWKVARGNLQTLDFTRVKQTLRESARKLFVDEETQNPTPLALQLSAQKGGAPVAAPIALPSTQKSSKGRLMTPDEKKRVVEAIKRAKTGEEVRKLERMLADGVVPDGGVDAATQED